MLTTPARNVLSPDGLAHVVSECEFALIGLCGTFTLAAERSVPEEASPGLQLRVLSITLFHYVYTQKTVDQRIERTEFSV